MFAALALLVAVVVYRILSGFNGSADFHWLHNFAPVSAIALCGAVYLPRKMAMILPTLMLLVSDIVLNVFHYHRDFFTFDILPRYLALALISVLGFALRERAGAGRLLGASLLGSVIFFVITNTGSWLYEPAYAKTVAGWFQAMTTGLPGYPSTWWFSRYTFLSDLFFTALFIACMSAQGKKESLARPVEAPALARG